MAELRIEWDPTKAAQNRRKHGVSFEEAKEVFFDERALLCDDPDHSELEDRFVLLGMSGKLRALVVVHSLDEGRGIIRLISARKADKDETRTYFQGWKR